MNKKSWEILNDNEELDKPVEINQNPNGVIYPTICTEF